MSGRQGSKDGAVVVVGDVELAARLRQALGVPSDDEQAVRSVKHYLAVLGEMSQTRVDVVVGRLGVLRSSLEGTIRAIRAMSPKAKLLLVAEAEQEPEAMRAVRLGFDDYHVEPLMLEAIVKQIRSSRVGDRTQVPKTTAVGVGVDAATNNGAAAGSEIGSSTSADASVATAGVGSFDDDEHDADPLLLDEPMRMISPLSTASTNDGGKLDWLDTTDDLVGSALAGGGDADLVEQLLRDRRGLRRAAMSKLRLRLEDPELTFSREPMVDVHACVPVQAASQELGYLVSEQTDAKVLAAHAAWLARWLMLGRHLGQLNEMAMRDSLTQVWNRRYFEQTLRVLVDRARAERFRVTLMMFDIDDFKDYNDQYGHGAGDEILCETARLMQSVVRRQDVVARIGGDEFAVIFWDAEPPRGGGGAEGKSDHPVSVRRAAERFQKAVCEHRFPKLAEQAPATLTISGGLASFPWDGRTPEQLVKLADEMMFESKEQGKNAITFGPGALRLCGLELPGEAE